MLNRLSSAIAATILAVGTTFALGAVPSFAASGPTCGRLGICVGTTQPAPGRPGSRGGGGGGGGGGKAAPMPCPGAVNCNAMGAGAAAPAPAIPTVDVAYNARDQLQLPAPHVHTSPAGKTYVQLKTSLWVNPADYAHEETSVAVPGQTATAIAEPQSVTWNMGENTVVCHTAGGPNSTTCGYTYQQSSAGQPNGKYAISATVTWHLRWTCAGAGCDAPAGDFPDPNISMTSNTTLAVGEVQTESRPG